MNTCFISHVSNQSLQRWHQGKMTRQFGSGTPPSFDDVALFSRSYRLLYCYQKSRIPTTDVRNSFPIIFAVLKVNGTVRVAPCISIFFRNELSKRYYRLCSFPTTQSVLFSSSFNPEYSISPKQR